LAKASAWLSAFRTSLLSGAACVSPPAPPELNRRVLTLMEPVFALPYSEYLAANLLSCHFKTRAGYSLFVPTSRQEKGIDLLLTKRSEGILKSASFQVKSSRTYSPVPARRATTIRYSYYTWFNTFQVPNQADFFLLVGIYPPEQNRTRKNAYTWWDSLVLLFTQGRDAQVY
jgi:hypothetical protein